MELESYFGEYDVASTDNKVTITFRIPASYKLYLKKYNNYYKLQITKINNEPVLMYKCDEIDSNMDINLDDVVIYNRDVVRCAAILCGVPESGLVYLYLVLGKKYLNF